MQIRIIIGLILASMAGTIWYLIDSKATVKAELSQETERAEGLAKQIVGISEEYTKRLNAQEVGYSVWNSISNESNRRRTKAEAVLLQTFDSKYLLWRDTPLPLSVTHSLCLKAGSCEMPTQRSTTQGNDGASIGASLTNESLRTGIEDYRQALSTCNGKLSGIAAWAEKVNETPRDK